MRAKPVFFLMLEDRRFKVFFWRNRKALNAATQRYYKNRKDKRRVACYLGLRNGDGQLHFIEPFLGAGYVAHELFHLCYHRMKNRRNEEEFANLIETATRQFWDNFYMLPENLGKEYLG